MAGKTPPSKALFRDCLRLADHIGKQNGNGKALREMVRQSFKQNMYESDPQKIEEAKMRYESFDGSIVYRVPLTGI
jgi:hypothetical protein